MSSWTALRAAPFSERAQLGLARVFIDRGSLDEADLLVDAALDGETSAAALVTRCRVKLARGLLREAAEDYNAAIGLDGDVADDDLYQRLSPYMDEPPEESERVPADDPDVGPIDLLVPVERPEVGFEGIGGMDAIKDAIEMMIIAPLEQPELYAAYGKSAGGGVLLFGPPGCGKTHFARATAGQIRSSFLSVGLNDVLDMWLGNSERRLHAVFEQARRSKPCVLFFDEVDALGASRGSFTGGAGRNVVNQFLAEMDGLTSNNEGVLVLAATNAPWHVDAAFRRPGRFDRVLFVPPPDESARAAILAIHIEGKPVEDLDLAGLAKCTSEFSGADLRAVVDQAVEEKLREAMRTGRPRPITTTDLMDAAKRVRPTTGEWFGTARNYALHANQTGAYDDIAAYLRLK